MSELIKKTGNRATIRWKLLTGASALALTAYVSAAKAEDADRPLIWLEFGGQMENMTGQGQVFAPDFLSVYSTSVVLHKITPTQAQKPPKFGFGEEGKISFQPEGSDWVFSAGLRVGRSGSNRHVHHQTNNVFCDKYLIGHPTCTKPSVTEKVSDTKAGREENHTIVDFSVGKDVGLGMFGKDATSTINIGVRFAQFASRQNFDIRARPDLNFKYSTFYSAYQFRLPYFHTYHATGHAARSFRGVGPSLTWNGSTPFAGNSNDGELTIDWSANAGVLFGKQKVRTGHQASAHYATAKYRLGAGHYFKTVYAAVPHHRTAIRSVTVPNVGGSVGLSWRVQDFKVSLGYRADFFFGAMDTGIDVAKKSNATFNGPYASISVGLGD